jgi:curved DNA-binding protein CbpA
MVETDYYTFLQVKPSATQEEVRAAYKRLAFLYHPDRSTHPQSTRQMQLLNEAYAVLSDPKKRAQFDQERLTPPSPPVSSEEKTTPLRQKPPDPAQYDHTAHTTREDRSLKHSGWLWSQLKTILSILILMIFLFFWSLMTGEVNSTAILILVLSALYVILSVVIKIRKQVI